jgi:hypothetical protein
MRKKRAFQLSWQILPNFDAVRTLFRQWARESTHQAL